MAVRNILTRRLNQNMKDIVKDWRIDSQTERQADEWTDK
jgi:hypothetical protein